MRRDRAARQPDRRRGGIGDRLTSLLLLFRQLGDRLSDIAVFADLLFPSGQTGNRPFQSTGDFFTRFARVAGIHLCILGPFFRRLFGLTKSGRRIRIYRRRSFRQRFGVLSLFRKLLTGLFTQFLNRLLQLLVRIRECFTGCLLCFRC